ncbi:GNAT family N-acetyltransferase [Acetobacter pasteurianus]|nr:GNAT family N-acetyltransferase [Acetobacter pasteurianus]
MDVEFEINGQAYSEFHEDDSELLRKIAQNVSYDILLSQLPNAFHLPGLNTHILPAADLAQEQIEELISIIDDNLGDLYIKNNGTNWKIDKDRDEMKEPGLVVVWFTEKDKTRVAGYISFKLCFDADERFVVYLYEIHFRKDFQGKSLGRLVMDQFHFFAKGLQRSDHSLYQRVKGTSLTVFSDNERALNWYKRLGYQLAENSPEDKVLRSGKIRKPGYYLLRRGIIS